MFVRAKKRPTHTADNMAIAVQVVESSRIDGQARQRVLKHVGVARTAAELAQLRRYGEYLRQQLLEQATGSLYAPDEVPKPPTRPRKRRPAPRWDELRHDYSVTTGVETVYLPIYTALKLDRVLPKSRYRAAHRHLQDTVLARLVKPQSKRATAAQLGVEFGVPASVDALYRMMDHLDDQRIDKIKDLVAHGSEPLLLQTLRVVLYDCTTLYFESTDADALRTFGYSKDGKVNRVQVLLALVVDPQGLPLTYEVFRGNLYEGATLQPVLQRLQASFPTIEDHVVVADASLGTRQQRHTLSAANGRYVTGARLKNLTKAQQAAILAKPWPEQAMAEWELEDGVRLAVWYTESRARHDRAKRDQRIDKLRKRVAAHTNPKAWLAAARGTAKFLRIEGDAHIELDDAAIADAARWDGLSGVVTNTDWSVAELRDQYHGLWQVERSFRIHKHDLRTRPIFHWTERRIHAHIAICYMAFACLRHVEHRLHVKQASLSPKRILDAVNHLQEHVLKDPKTEHRYAYPARPTEDAKTLLQALGIKRATTPRRIT